MILDRLLLAVGLAFLLPRHPRRLAKSVECDLLPFIGWYVKGSVVVLCLGPFRLLLGRADPTGFGNIVMDLLMYLHLARALRASAYFVKGANPISSAPYELVAVDRVTVIPQASLLSPVLQAMWMLVDGTRTAVHLLRLYRTRLGRRRAIREYARAEGTEASDRAAPITAASATADGGDADSTSLSLSSVLANFRRERQHALRHADYFGFNMRWLYASDPDPVRFPAKREQQARQQAQALGIQPGMRIVALHVRETGFHQTRKGYEARRDAVRNARIETYYPAIDRLVALGYTVVRIGDRTMTPLERPGVIDLANSPLRTDLCELWCVLQSEFAIVCDSGPLTLCWLTVKPCLVVNMTNPVSGYPLGPNDVYVLKHVVDLQASRELSLAKLITNDFVENRRDFERYDYIDNTSEEILEATQEMLACLKDAPPPTWAQQEYRRLIDDLYRDDAFHRAWRRKQGGPLAYVGSGRIGNAFAERHLYRVFDRMCRQLPLQPTARGWAFGDVVGLFESDNQRKQERIQEARAKSLARARAREAAQIERARQTEERVRVREAERERERQERARAREAERQRELAARAEERQRAREAELRAREAAREAEREAKARVREEERQREREAALPAREAERQREREAKARVREAERQRELAARGEQRQRAREAELRAREAAREAEREAKTRARDEERQRELAAKAEQRQRERQLERQQERELKLRLRAEEGPEQQPTTALAASRPAIDREPSADSDPRSRD